MGPTEDTPAPDDTPAHDTAAHDTAAHDTAAPNVREELRRIAAERFGWAEPTPDQLAAMARGVAVSTVLPAAIDTPIYAAAANHSGRRIAPPPPVYRPERVAATIVAQLRRPRREVVSGGLLGRLFVAQHALAPRLTEYLMAQEVDRTLTRPERPVPPTSGVLHEPAAAPTPATGGWDGQRRERRRRAAAVGGVAAAAPLAEARRGG